MTFSNILGWCILPPGLPLLCCYWTYYDFGYCTGFISSATWVGPRVKPGLGLLGLRVFCLLIHPSLTIMSFTFGLLVVCV